jgi:hypothetical protein
MLANAPKAENEIGHWHLSRLRLVLHLEKELSALAGERVFNRLRQLARLIGREPHLAVG